MKRTSIKTAWVALLGTTLVLAPTLAMARGHTSVGIGIGVGGGYGYGPGFYGPGYYYPPDYYYGPNYYYPPPQVVYEQPTEPEVIVQQAPGAFWYYCPPAKNYFPYVKECPSGWQAVPAQQQAAGNLKPAPAPQGRVTYRLGDVLFATGRSELEAGATGTLDSLLASINKEPERRIVIEGHTDTVGGSTQNLGLSQRRADAVKQYLVEHGVAAGRVTAVGKGEGGAIADNATAEGRQKNRRVDIIVG